MITAKYYCLVFTSIFLLACSSWNPSVNIQPTDTKLPWSDYEQVKTTTEKIVMGETTYEDMLAMGLNPYLIPNTTKMIDVRPELLPNNSSRVEDLPDYAQICYRKAAKCVGYKFNLRPIMTKGNGSLFLRWLRIKKKDITTGWGVKFDVYLLPREEFQVLSSDDPKRKEMVVIFGLFGGEPNIYNVVTRSNPLGFFGSFVGSVRNYGGYPAPDLDVN